MDLHETWEINRGLRMGLLLDTNRRKGRMEGMIPSPLWALPSL